MRTDSYYNFLEKYVPEHTGDFIASHETNNANVPEKIFLTGLRVTHSPYGRKIRRFINENGSINLDCAFMATMSPVDSKSLKQDKMYFETPTAPIIINIPKELLEITGESASNEDCFEFFCGYGYEERPTGTDRCGKITPLESEQNANVRLLPSYLIAGTFNPETNKFIENDKHFSKLPKEEQDKIINNLKLKYELLNQSQPQ